MADYIRLEGTSGYHQVLLISLETDREGEEMVEQVVFFSPWEGPRLEWGEV